MEEMGKERSGGKKGSKGEELDNNGVKKRP